MVPEHGKLLLLREMEGWMEQWKSSKTLGHTNQTFDSLILICRTIVNL